MCKSHWPTCEQIPYRHFWSAPLWLRYLASTTKGSRIGKVGSKQSAVASNMTYCPLRVGKGNARHTEVLWHPEQHDAYLHTIVTN